MYENDNGDPGRYGSGAPESGGPWGYGYGYGTPPPPPQRSGLRRALAYVAVAVVAAGAGAGAAVALNHPSSTSSSASPGFGSGTGDPFGSGNGFGGAGSGSGSSGSGSLNVQSLENRVDPGIVDITSQLKYNDATAEGTGMVISAGGLVLTNNHVIDQATSVSATIAVSGKTYAAKVIGYDATHDVALLQLVGASGLKTVSLGNSSGSKAGESVLALGNAGGRGGLPSTAQGTIEGTGRTIEASDSGANTTEVLHDMLQTSAPIQEGDSGGPLVNSSGQVIGMDTAANASSAAPGSNPSANATGFAIPVNDATAIERQIASGRATTTVHIGLAGFMGISVADASKGCSGQGGIGSGSGGGSAQAHSGAMICEVFPGTPAQSAGLSNGDVITAADGHAITNEAGLTSVTATTHPGDLLKVSYVNSSGTQHTASFALTEWAK